MAKYEEKLTPLHDNLEVKECGLFISVENPFIGASPDGVIECKCCGWGIIEIKVSILSRHCIVMIHHIILTLYSVHTVTEMRRLKRQHRIEDFVWKADRTANLIHSREITLIIIRYMSVHANCMFKIKY